MPDDWKKLLETAEGEGVGHQMSGMRMNDMRQSPDGYQGHARI